MSYAYERQKINPKMDLAMEIEIAEPRMPYKLVAERVGVKYRTLCDWHSTDLWKKEKARRLKEKFGDFEAKAIDNLEMYLNEGEWKATQYVLDSLGYNATQKVEVDSNTIKVSIVD